MKSKKRRDRRAAPVPSNDVSLCYADTPRRFVRHPRYLRGDMSSACRCWWNNGLTRDLFSAASTSLWITPAGCRFFREPYKESLSFMKLEARWGGKKQRAPRRGRGPRGSKTPGRGGRGEEGPGGEYGESAQGAWARRALDDWSMPGCPVRRCSVRYRVESPASGGHPGSEFAAR